VPNKKAYSFIKILHEANRFTGWSCGRVIFLENMVSRKTRLKFFKSTQRAWRRCIQDALIHKLFIVSKNPFTHILYGYVAFNFCKKKNRFFDPKQRERSLKINKSYKQKNLVGKMDRHFNGCMFFCLCFAYYLIVNCSVFSSCSECDACGIVWPNKRHQTPWEPVEKQIDQIPPVYSHCYIELTVVATAIQLRPFATLKRPTKILLVFRAHPSW